MKMDAFASNLQGVFFHHFAYLLLSKYIIAGVTLGGVKE